MNKIFIGNQLKKLRKKHGITQKQLSVLSNIPLNTIKKYENNTREPTIYNIVKLKKTLRSSYNTLIEFNNIIK